MADGTTNPAYPQSLQQILGQPQTPGVFGYGFSQGDIQRLQDAGVTWQQLMGMGLGTQPQTTTSAYQSGGQGPTTSPSAGGIQQSNNAAMLQAMLKLGGGQQQDQTPPPPGNYYGQQFPLYAQDAQGNPTGKPIYANPTNQASLLGAAALQMPAVINQPPSAALDPRSGVSKVGGALIGSTVPMVPGQQATWTQLAQANALSPNDIAEFQKTGLAPADVANKFGLSLKVPQPQAVLAGPWSTQPGTFVKAATPTPTQAAPLVAAQPATATAYTPTATPFATPPAAPGMPAPMQMPLPVLAAHTSGLAEAGRALFAHFGGDPNSAGPADIANFHSQLTGAIGSLPVGPLAAAPQPTAAKKMRSGGLVPGRGNQDTVPALLTPGEYVIPKDQVAQVFGGRTPVRMQSGGSVTDDDRNTPSEARRQTLSAPTPPTQSSQPPAAPGAGHSSLISGLTQAAHAYGNSMANLPRNPIGSGGGVDIRNTRLDPDPDIPYLKAAGMMGGGAGSGQPTANALSGIGSGLSQAAQAIASSVGPWQVQQSAIPDPSQFQRPPQIQFQQPRIV